MSRSVVFNGITRYTPGGIVKVNTNGLNQVSFTAPSVIALIGESDGGVPGSPDGPIRLSDPAKAVSLFRSGPLVDAITTAFQSSGDSRIPGGASEVLIYKTNASTQSSVHVPDTKNSLSRDLAAATSTTTVVKLTTGGLTTDQVVDRWVSVGTLADPTLATLVATGGDVTSAVVATSADLYVGKLVKFGAATTTALLQDEYALIVANDGTKITFDHTLPAAVANTDTFDVVTTSRSRVVSNIATQLTVTPALPSAPAAGDGVYIHNTLAEVTTKDYGLHTAATTLDLAVSGSAYRVTTDQAGDVQLSENIGGSIVFQMVYKGGTNAVSTDTVSTGTAPTATSLTLTTGGLTPGAHDGATVVVTNPATGVSEQLRVSANTASLLTLESPGLSSDFLTEVAAATTGTVLVDIKNVTSAVSSVTGSSGLATKLTTTVTGVAGDDLSLTIGATTTLQQLADAANANTNYTAVVPSGINGSLLASELDFDAFLAINIQKDIAVNGSTGLKRDLQELVNWFNASSDYASATRYVAETGDGGSLGDSAVTEATFSTPLQMTGGTRGASTNSSFQKGFDALLLKNDAALVVPLIDRNLADEALGSTATWASVAAQLAAHVTAARGVAGTERGGFIGFRGKKAAYIAACNTLNDYDVQCVSQYPTILDATGTLTKFGPRMQAVMGASMRAGVPEVGEPLTHKFLRVSALTQDSSWDPTDATDASDLIKAGALFAEVIPGKGTRWVRDLTTWVKSDNLACAEGSVRSIVRTVAKGMRDNLDEEFTGLKAKPTTVGAVRNAMATLLNLYREDNLIVDSTDPATGETVRAWHALKVFTDGDVLRVNVEVFPVPGINFELTEIFLQMPTQSA